MAPSEFGSFWRRKQKTVFQLIDVNHDGVITMEDFDVISDRFIKEGHLVGDQAKEIKEKYRELYKTYYHSDDGPQSCEATIQKKIQFGKEHLLKMTTYFYSAYFDIMDTNKDDRVDLSEFTIFFKVYGLSPQVAKECFKHLDTNKDGTLSREEFVTGGNNYFQLEEEGDSSDYFYGPIVD